jgi:hypothetical protein
MKYNGFSNAKAGDYIMFKDIALGEGYGTIVLEYSSNNSNAKWIEIKLDSVNGKTIEKIDLPYSKGQLLFDKQNEILHPFVRLKHKLTANLQGTHHLYIVFGGGEGKEVAQIVIVRFEDYKGNIPLLNNEAQIEVRLDDKDGDVVAVFYPHNTGGKFRKSIETIITNKPISGKHKLYFTSKSLGNPTFRLKSVSIGEVTNNIN